MSIWLQDRWFVLACVAMAFAVVFLLAAADTAGVVPLDTFIGTGERLWKFIAGGAIGAAALKLYQSQSAKRGGGDPAADAGG